MSEQLSRNSGPSELEVQAGAVILATTPLIDAPKLDHMAWMGLSRSILEAAAAARCTRSESVRSVSEVSIPLAEALNEPCKGCGKRPVDFMEGK